MEMALRAQSPLCSRSRPVLVVRPANAAAGLAQSITRCSGFTRSRLVRYMVASSGLRNDFVKDYPKRNSKRTSTPKPKGTASGGYTPRPTVQSSTKKVEQSSTDEGNDSCSATLEGADDADEAEAEEEVEQNQSPSLSSTSMDDESIDRELDVYRGKISALVGSKPEPSSLASIHGQNRLVIGVHEQDKSVVNSHEQDRSNVGVPKQSQSTVRVTGEDPMKQTTIVSGHWTVYH